MKHTNNKYWRYAPLCGYGYIIVFLLGLIASTAGNRTPGGYPTPWSNPEHIQAFYSDGHLMSALGAITQSIAGFLFVIFIVVLSDRVGRTREDILASRLIFAGGSVTATCLFVSAVCSWLVSRPEIFLNNDLLRLVQDLSFAAGGVGYALSVALLASAVLSTRFVSLWWYRMLGRFLMICGLLSVFTFVEQGFSIFLPLARFGSFVWIAFAAWYLFSFARQESER